MTQLNNTEMLEALIHKTLAAKHVDIDLTTMKRLQDLADLPQTILDHLPAEVAYIRIETSTMIDIIKKAIFLHSDEFLNEIAENWESPLTTSKRKLKR